MIVPVACVLYTQDSDLVRRTHVYLRSLTQVRHVGQAERLEAVLQQNRPALLLLDLRDKEGHDLLMQAKTQYPDVLIIGFGTLRSEPSREAEQAGIYAVEDVNLERRLFQALVGRALDHLHVLEDNRALRGDSARSPIPRAIRFWVSIRTAEGRFGSSSRMRSSTVPTASVTPWRCSSAATCSTSAKKGSWPISRKRACGWRAISLRANAT